MAPGNAACEVVALRNDVASLGTDPNSIDMNSTRSSSVQRYLINDCYYSLISGSNIAAVWRICSQKNGLIKPYNLVLIPL